MVQMVDATADSPAARSRPRGRRVAFLSVLMAGVYFCGTDVALNGGERWGLEWDGLRRTNSARALMMTLMPTPSTMPRLGGLLLSPGMGPDVLGSGVEAISSVLRNGKEQDARNHNLRQVAAVEGVATLWGRTMYGLCGLLAMVAVLSWVTRWGRGWHLLAAAAIFGIALFSLACLRYLEISEGAGGSVWPLSPESYAALVQRWNIPEGGGMPPLLPRTYWAVGVLVSAYGWLLIVLIVLFARPSRRAACAATEAV